ncbi:M23 family metallopeptidase [Microbacterium sp. gxy059]|uniref:M23 family metallopeptidase n=1 Tax=Microbacterium sp. gxy059 TaxID=2957199 RepID=UPI003D989DF6
MDEDGLFSLVGTFNQAGVYNMYSGAEFNIGSGGTMSLDGLFRILSGGRLTLQGVLDILSGGALNVRSGGGVNVLDGGDIDVQSGGEVRVRGGDMLVYDDGEIRVGQNGMIQINGPIPIRLHRGTIGGVDQAMIQFGESGNVRIAANSAGGNPMLLLQAGQHYIRISDSGITMSDNAGGGENPGGPGEPGEDLGFFQWPFSLSLVTSEYGPRTYPYVGFHEGIDFAGGAASAGGSIPAAADGTVAESVTGHPGWGNYVRLNHITPSGKLCATLYAHMIEAPAVSSGQSVQKGQIIGRVGNTGNSFGAHLHFETWSEREYGSHMNPRDFMALYGPG